MRAAEDGVNKADYVVNIEERTSVVIVVLIDGKIHTVEKIDYGKDNTDVSGNLRYKPVLSFAPEITVDGILNIHKPKIRSSYRTDVENVVNYVVKKDAFVKRAQLLILQKKAEDVRDNYKHSKIARIIQVLGSRHNTSFSVHVSEHEYEGK